MNKSSRTSRSIKNSVIATIFYLINLCLQFYSRKIFLDVLGTEVLGLNTTAMNLLQFLNLAELGISAGVSFMLYRPLYEGNNSAINEIVSLQGKFYKRVAASVIIGSVILMLFFPLIFKKINLPLWYAYASFGVLLYSALIGYFFNYKQVVLTASQQDFKMLYSYKSVMIIKVLVQSMAVYYLADGYIWWLVLEAVFATISSITLNWMTKSTFPELRNVKQPFNVLRAKYPDFSTKIKQLFFHKIGAFILNQSSPLIIYSFTSLSVVALYGNYLIIYNGVKSLLSSIFNGVNASIGNLIAEGNMRQIETVFMELFSVRFFIVTTICYVVLQETQNFIRLWIGNQYVMSMKTLILIVLMMYINLSRYSVDQFIYGFGLYQDIYAPIIELALNLTLSVTLGSIYGLNGVLMGVIVSLLLVIKIWKPFFLFKKGMKLPFYQYVMIVLKNLLCATGAYVIAIMLIPTLISSSPDNYIQLIMHAVINFIIFGFSLFSLLFISRSGLEHFVGRMIKISQKKP